MLKIKGYKGGVSLSFGLFCIIEASKKGFIFLDISCNRALLSVRFATLAVLQ